MARRITTTLILATLLAGTGAFFDPAGAARMVRFRSRDAGTFAIPGNCGNGDANVVIGGAGNASHLGRYTFSANECFNTTSGDFAGTATLAGANGASITGTYVGQVFASDEPDLVTYAEVFHITGGTGRFAGASGDLHVNGTADLATGEYTQILWGDVSATGNG